MDVVNKKTDEIMKILGMNVQPMSSINDKNMSTQPNRVIPDHLPGSR